MKRHCLFKSKETKLKLRQFNNKTTLFSRLPQLKNDKIQCDDEKQNDLVCFQKSLGQRNNSQDKRIINFTIDEQVSNDIVIIEKLKRLTTDEKNPIARMKKSYSTSKCLQANIVKQAKYDFAKFQRATELRYLRKRRQLESYFIAKAIISKNNEHMYSISQGNMNKIINTILYLKTSQKEQKNNYDNFLKHNTFLVSIDNFVNKDSDFFLNNNNQKILLKFSEKIESAKKQQIRHREIIQYLKNKISELKRQQKKLQSQVQRTTKILNNVSTALNSIENYPLDNSTPLMNIFGKQYLFLQQQLKEYAIKLQSLKLLEQVKSQMAPFQTIQKNIVEKLKEINHIVKLDKTISPTEKLDMLKNYINKSIDIFKNRDDQIRSKLSLKSKYVVEFVQMMKKWHLNQLFKCQYLQNLKKQFITYYYEIDNKIDESIELCKNEQFQLKQIASHLLVNLKNIQQKQLRLLKIYEMGNMFY